HGELGAYRDQLSGGGARRALILVRELHAELEGCLQTVSFGRQVCRRIDPVELDDFARPGPDDIDQFLFIERVDGERSESGRRDLAGHDPALAEGDRSFTHEESHTVFEDGDRFRAGGPKMRVGNVGFRLRRIFYDGKPARQQDSKQSNEDRATAGDSHGTPPFQNGSAAATPATGILTPEESQRA